MDDEALSLAVSHDGRYFATGGTAAVVKLWSYDGGDLVFEGKGHSGVITGLRYAGSRPWFCKYASGVRGGGRGVGRI